MLLIKTRIILEGISGRLSREPQITSFHMEFESESVGFVSSDTSSSSVLGAKESDEASKSKVKIG